MWRPVGDGKLREGGGTMTVGGVSRVTLGGVAVGLRRRRELQTSWARRGTVETRGCEVKDVMTTVDASTTTVSSGTVGRSGDVENRCTAYKRPLS